MVGALRSSPGNFVRSDPHQQRRLLGRHGRGRRLGAFVAADFGFNMDTYSLLLSEVEGRGGLPGPRGPLSFDFAQDEDLNIIRSLTLSRHPLSNRGPMQEPIMASIATGCHV